MKKICWHALLMCVLPATASVAQEPQSVRSSAALSIGGTPPWELAESVVIFVPAVDTPFVTADEDVYLKGSITHTERGETPGAIVMTAHTLTASHPAGVPVRLYLMRHPERDAWYSIYSGVVDTTIEEAAHAAVLASSTTTLSVQTYSPLGQAVNKIDMKGVPYGFGAELRIESGADGHADLYFGVIPPDGVALTWTDVDGSAQIVTGMRPLRGNIRLDVPGTFHSRNLFERAMELSFDGSEAAGLYQVFALLVKAGADPADASNWIAEDFSALFVE